MTAEQLKAISPYTPDKRIADDLPKLNDCLERYNIVSPIEICHFLAQILHESGYLRYREEIASGEAYENRKDLGNIYLGDGKKFKGRGWVQLTGRNNYERYGADIKQDLITHPELVATQYYADVAGWFWSKKALNHYADLDDITSITKIINGGLNGIDDRKANLERAKKVLIIG